MNILPQTIFNGFTIGSIYAVIAVGLNLVLGVLGVVNFAQGEYYMLGAFIVYVFFFSGFPYWICILIAILVIIIVGVIASLALPRFFELIEYSISTEALAAMGAIRQAMERCNLM